MLHVRHLSRQGHLSCCWTGLLALSRAACRTAAQGDTPPELVNRWGQDTFDHYLALYQSPEAPEAGAPARRRPLHADTLPLCSAAQAMPCYRCPADL
jgi:hypothetical protein